MPEPLTRPSPVFRLDVARKELTADGMKVSVPPKALDLLLFFLARPNRVLTRAELLDGVWEATSVSPDAIRYAVKELRRALGDSASKPVFIETISRRGWSFIGRGTRVSAESWILEGRARSERPGAQNGRSDPTPFVGREAEMASLLDLFSRAQSGDRKTLFIRGEPGVGKSRLVSAFLETANLQHGTLTARAECVEHAGPGMPYTPLFDVLEHICEQVGSDLAIETLRRHAPTWLAQMPSLTEPEDRAVLEAQVQGSTGARMIREWARGVESFAEGRTIVIAIEDLHWTDPSTLFALIYFATRVESARILIVVTLRPEASKISQIDLQQGIEELSARETCELLSLAGFDLAGIEAYLGARFGQDEPVRRSAELCEYLLAASAGNPLFVVSLVDGCVESGLVRRVEKSWTAAEPLPMAPVPAKLRPLIVEQLESLDAELRDLVDAASVVGRDFCAAELAAVESESVDVIEASCERLVLDGRFVVGRGPIAWPDGTVSSGYRFKHDLHREVLHDRLSPGRRSRISRAIGERLRDAFVGREEAVAARLAVHFERGLDPISAAGFFRLAGEASARRFANFEAVEHFRKALHQMAQSVFDGRGVLEIQTRLALCAPLASVAGYAAEELEENLAHLEDLTSDLEDSAEMFPALLGLWSLNFVRADFDRTADLGDRMLGLAKRASSSVLHLQAHQSVGHSLFYRGEVLEAQRHYDRATRDYEASAHERQDYSVGDDPLVLVLTCRALSYWFLGRSDEACRSAEEAVRHGERLAHPPSLALAWTYGAVLHQLRGDVDRAKEWSEQSLAITTSEGIPFWMELSRIVCGWSMARADVEHRAEGIDLIRSGIAGWTASGSSLGLPHFYSLLADSLGHASQIDEGLEVLGIARELMESTGQFVFRSQLDRLEGDLFRLRGAGTGDESELASARSCYLRAAEEAESRGLRANQLQAWMAVGELDGMPAEVARRIADLISLYPTNTETDLDLGRARERLSASS